MSAAWTWIPLSLAAAAFAALVAIFGKLGVKQADPLAATALRALFMAATAFLAVLAVRRSLAPLVPVAAHGRGLAWIAAAGLAGALSWICGFYAMRTGPVAAVSALDRLSVVLVWLASMLLLGDPFKWQHLLGSLLMLGGALLFLF